MIKYLPLLIVLLVSCTPHTTDVNIHWNLPASTTDHIRTYHPQEGKLLHDSIPSEKEIIQRMNVRLECQDSSVAQRIEVVQQDCLDCYQEWVIDCQNDNQFFVVVSEETGRGGFFLFEGRPFS